jgi:hypothetical protein
MQEKGRAMSSIAKRIEKLEKIMSVGKERKISELIISGHEGDGTLQEQENLGPVETWLTYQEQLATAREDQADCDHRLIVIGLSVERELQAREFQNSPLEEEKRAERIQEYRTLYKDMLNL